ncbi:unnamed protein product [Ilex paraguariensis]|uniref:WRKY domain-containing protein n=1 Tax=Ilex paraguariensis TaxID=185542 RepID=A0ABC8QLH5_9AQUA
MVNSREGVSENIPSDELKRGQHPDTGFHEVESNQEESSLSVLPQNVSSKLQPRKRPSTEAHVAQSNQESSLLPIVPGKVSDNLPQRHSLDDRIPTSQSEKERSSLSILPKEESDNLQLRENLYGEIPTPQSNQEGSSLPIMPVSNSNKMQQSRSPDTGLHALESNQEGQTLSTIPQKISDCVRQIQDPDTGVPASQTDQEKNTFSVRPQKVLDKLQPRRNPDIGALQPDQIGSSPSRIPVKTLEDGYNWRKYGQKLVKGNEFIRSYYKCTYPNCLAKKQVERSHDGKITDIKYLGNHGHPKPQNGPQITAGMALPIQAVRPDVPHLPIAGDESSNASGVTSDHIGPTETYQLSTVAESKNDVEGAVSQANIVREEVDKNGDPASKRQKRDTSSLDDTQVDKLNGEPRQVVQTMSEVDIVNDGYRWRKYGQKLVKGNPNPRSYYRCSNAGCPAKKQMERASHDANVVITTYEGQHDHDIPPARTVTHTTVAAANTSTETLNGESRSRPEDKAAAGLEMVVHISAS